MKKFKKCVAVAAAIISISSISAVVYANNQPISLLSNDEAVVEGTYANYYFSPTYAKVENKTTSTRYMTASIMVYNHNTDTQAFQGSLFASGSGGYNASVKVDGSSEYPAGRKYDYHEICSIYNGAVPYSNIAESQDCLVRAQ